MKGWSYHASRNISEYLPPDDSSPIQLPKTFCDPPSFVLVLVYSSPENREARDAIRETWASHKNISDVTLSFFFLLGETRNQTLQEEILEEGESLGDVIQERFLDAYTNLTLKTVTMLKLVSKHCLNSTRFVLKIDDDIFLRTDAFVEKMKNKTNEKDVILGEHPRCFRLQLCPPISLSFIDN